MPIPWMPQSPLDRFIEANKIAVKPETTPEDTFSWTGTPVIEQSRRPTIENSGLNVVSPMETTTSKTTTSSTLSEYNDYISTQK